MALYGHHLEGGHYDRRCESVIGEPMTRDGLVIDRLGGHCPVQAKGTVDGKPFYFRARDEHWSMRIGGTDVVGAPEWMYEEEYDEGPSMAGWMTEDEARAFIDKAVRLYRAREPALARHGGTIRAVFIRSSPSPVTRRRRNVLWCTQASDRGTFGRVRWRSSSGIRMTGDRASGAAPDGGGGRVCPLKKPSASGIR